MTITDYDDKKILVMGLGVHGGGLGVARFMARAGAWVRVTDLRRGEELREAMDALEGEQGSFAHPVEYTLGEHREEDFRWADVIVKNQAVPYSSKWITLARSFGKRVEMEFSIFLRLYDGPVLAVTGTKGKSTTATWAWEMVRHWRPDALLAGNLRVSALEALPRIEPGTPVVLELSSYQLEGLEEARISPHIAAVTNLYPDHMDRYRGMDDYGEAKKQIVLYQQPGDWAVLNADDPLVRVWSVECGVRSGEVDSLLHTLHSTLHTRSGVAWFGKGVPPAGGVGVFVRDGVLEWHAPSGEVVTIGGVNSGVQVPGEHNLLNAACAATMALLAGAPLEAVRAGLYSFRGVADRLELLRTIGGVRFYNDTTSTTPTSTIAALDAVKGPVVLIAGGADKKLDFGEVSAVAAQKTLAVALLEGTATEQMARQMEEAGVKLLGRFNSLESAVQAAREATPAGGAVLLSPATASFGMFRNEFERGERFREIVINFEF